MLKCFCAYTFGMEYDGPLTLDISLSWACLGDASDKTPGRRLEILRPFSKFAASVDDEAQIIPSKIFAGCHSRPEPYILSEEEVVELMEACKGLYPEGDIRGRSIETILGLLWATGLRPSEPIKLTVSDVDLDRNVLFIKRTKFNKSRCVPIAGNVAAKLADYSKCIESERGARKPEDPFFLTTGWKPLKGQSLQHHPEMAGGRHRH